MSTDYPPLSSRTGQSSIFVGLFAVAVVCVASYVVWNHWQNSGTQPAATSTPSMVQKLLSPAPVAAPVLAQADVMKYPATTYTSGRIEIEGKIYNPNAIPLKNVHVEWKIYLANNDVLVRQGFETTCSFDFAFIPPQTTYDFKTNKIRFRDADVMDSIGKEPVDAPMNLRPEIKFASEP